MTRYIQKISLGGGRERWIGWEIDGIGSEIPGLHLAEQFSPEELAERGVRKFVPMTFDDFLRLGATIGASPPEGRLEEQDLEFRLDALLVAMERLRSQGSSDVPLSLLVAIFGDGQIDDDRIQSRFRDWQYRGAVLVVGRDDCYLKVLRRLA